MKQVLSKHCWRFLPGGVTAVAIALLLKLGTFQPLEQIAYRQLFQIRGATPWDDRIVLIAIDDASLKQLGRFPWSRQYYAKLLNTLAVAEPNIVAFALLWSEPTAQDAKLAQAITQHGHVLLAQGWDKAGAPLPPVTDLANGAIAVGHVMKRQDSDSLIRQIDPQIHEQSALAVAAAQAYSLVQTPVPLPDLDAPLWVNWVSPAAQLRSYSFVDVIEGKIPPQNFRHKIVVVGVTATGLDPLVTPFNRNPPTSSVYLHATVINNLLQQSFLHPIPSDKLWLLFLLIAPGLSWFMSGWNTRQQLVVISGLCCGWGLLGVLLFNANYLLPIAPPIALFITTALAVALSDRLREDYLLRREIAHLWTHYHRDLITNGTESDQSFIAVQQQKFPHPQNPVSQVAQLAALAEQLGRSQATQAAIAHTLPIGLLASDLDGTVWFCNPVAAQFLQVGAGSDLNHRLVPAWLSPEQWQSSLEYLKANDSIKFSNLQQGDRWFDIILQPLVYRTLTYSAKENSGLNGFLLLLEDITEYKDAETELEQAKEIAIREASRSEEASRAKSEFLANMSHELRTPLNVILGFTQVMNHDHALSPEHQKNLEIINRSGQHLLGLINDVLEMSKIEAGRSRLNETSFDLYHLLDDLESMLRVRADAKQLTLIVERSPHLVQYITSDEGKLRQVLMNLIGNAIKFTNAGSVTLRVTLDNKDAGKSPTENSEEPRAGLGLYHPSAHPSHQSITLLFEVEDTGPGIAPDELPYLFQPFAQARAGRQANEGTGLGLAISRKFINLMGGDIVVCSEIAQGSSFKFHIQVRPAEIIEPMLPMKVDRVVALASDQPAYRILIVEDQWESSQFLVKLLAPLGFDVREARNGQEGIALWQKWHPHLILMDMRMPVMDGYEATRKIRLQESLVIGQRSAVDSSELMTQDKGQNRLQESLVIGQRSAVDSLELMTQDKGQKTIIIALTASVFEETEAAAVAIGCDDFLRKPIQEDVLLVKLAEHLDVRYVYEDAGHATDNGSHFSAVTAISKLHAHLDQMPIEWIEQLHYCAVKGSDRLILQLIDQIPPAHAPLAQTLTKWVNNFQFDEIIDLAGTH